MLRTSWTVFMVFILFGCAPKSEPVINGEFTRVVFTANYNDEIIAEITDADTINELIDEINDGKREDITDIVMERGPDGTVRMMNDKDTIVLKYFSEHSPLSFIWIDNQDVVYGIDTNITVAELLN